MAFQITLDNAAGAALLRAISRAYQHPQTQASDKEQLVKVTVQLTNTNEELAKSVLKKKF